MKKLLFVVVLTLVATESVKAAGKWKANTGKARVEMGTYKTTYNKNGSITTVHTPAPTATVAQ